MFSDFAVSVYFGIGVAGWIYSKMDRRTGGDFRDTMIVTVGVALVAALFMYVFIQLLF